MRPPLWKVGDLARRTGLTVRALHHYDEIGLLVPSQHTNSGHRLYTAGDVERLQRIKSLRQLGFDLKEIRECLADSNFSAPLVIRRHAERVSEQIAGLQRLRNRLESLAEVLETTETASVEDFLNVIEEITMYEKYYTPEQLEKIRERSQMVGQERIAQVEAEWPELMAQVQAEMDKGTAPEDPSVQQLAKRWMALVEEFTGGDPGINQSLKNMYQDESNAHGMQTQPIREMMKYINRSLEASRLED